MTNYSRSVLKSNGLPRPKIRLKKFGFSSKSVPANIAKKLPPQRCSKLLLIAFSASLTNGPRSLSCVKAGTHSAFGEESHTAAYTPKQGPSGRGRYHYPRSAPHVHKHPRAGCQNGVLCRFGILAGRCSRRTQKAFGTAMRPCVSLSRRRRGPAGLRDLFRFCRNCSLYALRSGPFRMCETGAVSLPSVRSACC